MRIHAILITKDAVIYAPPKRKKAEQTQEKQQEVPKKPEPGQDSQTTLEQSTPSYKLIGPSRGKLW